MQDLQYEQTTQHAKVAILHMYLFFINQNFKRVRHVL